MPKITREQIANVATVVIATASSGVLIYLMWLAAHPGQPNKLETDCITQPGLALPAGDVGDQKPVICSVSSTCASIVNASWNALFALYMNLLDDYGNVNQTRRAWLEFICFGQGNITLGNSIFSAQNYEPCNAADSGNILMLYHNIVGSVNATPNGKLACWPTSVDRTTAWKGIIFSAAVIGGCFAVYKATLCRYAAKITTYFFFRGQSNNDNAGAALLNNNTPVNVAVDIAR